MSKVFLLNKSSLSIHDFFFGQDLFDLIHKNPLKKIPILKGIYCLSMYYGKYMILPNILENGFPDLEIGVDNMLSPMNLANNYLIGDSDLYYKTPNLPINFSKFNTDFIFKLNFDVLYQHNQKNFTDENTQMSFLRIDIFNDKSKENPILRLYLKISFIFEKDNLASSGLKTIKFISSFILNEKEESKTFSFEILAKADPEKSNFIIKNDKIRFNSFEKRVNFKAILSQQNMIFGVENLHSNDESQNILKIYFYLNEDIENKYILFEKEVKDFLLEEEFENQFFSNIILGNTENSSILSTEKFANIFLRIGEILVLKGNLDFIEKTVSNNSNYVFSAKKNIDFDNFIISSSNILPIRRVSFEKSPSSAEDILFKNMKINLNQIQHELENLSTDNCKFETTDRICIECLDNYILDWDENECVFCEDVFSSIGNKCLKPTSVEKSDPNTIKFLQRFFFIHQSRALMTYDYIFNSSPKQQLGNNLHEKINFYKTSRPSDVVYIERLDYFVNSRLYNALQAIDKSIPFNTILMTEQQIETGSNPNFIKKFFNHIADTIEGARIVFHFNFIKFSNLMKIFYILQQPNYYAYASNYAEIDYVRMMYVLGRVIEKYEKRVYQKSEAEFLEEIKNENNLNHINSYHCLQENTSFYINGIYSSTCVDITEKEYENNWVITNLNFKKSFKCKKGCKICKNQESCEVCNDGFFKATNNICLKCHNKCKKCEKFEFKCIESFEMENQSASHCALYRNDKCLICDDDFYLLNNKCSRCPPHQFFEEETKKCKNCHIGCKECENQSFCSECYNQYFLNNKNKCSRCSINCSICENEDFCEICLPKFELINGKCIKILDYKIFELESESDFHPLSKKNQQKLKFEKIDYQDNNEVKIFYPNISFCRIQIQSQCFLCQTSYFLDKNSCLKCNQNCLICQNAENCLTCQKGYDIKINSNKNSVCEFNSSKKEKKLIINDLTYSKSIPKINPQNINCANCISCQNFGNLMCALCEKCYEEIKLIYIVNNNKFSLMFFGFLSFKDDSAFENPNFGKLKENEEDIFKNIDEKENFFVEYHEDLIQIFVKIEVKDLKKLRINISNKPILETNLLSQNLDEVKLDKTNEKKTKLFKTERSINKEYDCKTKFIVNFTFKPENISFFISNYIDRKTEINFIVNEKCIYNSLTFYQRYQQTIFNFIFSFSKLSFMFIAPSYFLAFLNYKYLLDVTFFIKKKEFNDLDFFFKYLETYNHKEGFKLSEIFNGDKKSKDYSNKTGTSSNYEYERLNVFSKFSVSMMNYSISIENFIFPYFVVLASFLIIFFINLLEFFLKSKNKKLLKFIKTVKWVVKNFLNNMILIFYFENLLLFLVSILFIKFKIFSFYYFLLIILRVTLIVHPFFFQFDTFNYLRRSLFDESEQQIEQAILEESEEQKLKYFEDIMMIKNYLKNVLSFIIVILYNQEKMMIFIFLTFIQVSYVVNLRSTVKKSSMLKKILVVQETYFILFFYNSIKFMSSDKGNNVLFMIIYLTGISISTFFFSGFILNFVRRYMYKLYIKS